jgi:[FeFe] hydrogenase H-cluster maturation GTPase HydF
MMTKTREAKPHIGIFGRRNNGKSSFINALTGQDVAIVSEHAGTTTDPVRKSLEIHGIGPVILIDTAGIDDTGDLGKLRTEKTMAIVSQSDLAILVIAGNRFGTEEEDLIGAFNDSDLPYIVVHTKADMEGMNQSTLQLVRERTLQDPAEFSSVEPERYFGQLLEQIRLKMPAGAVKRLGLLGDLLTYGDIVLLITPIDIEAPEGRLILPQVQTIRDILDNDCTAIVLKEREVDAFLRKTGIRPALVITDSQVFLKADASIPRDIPLTSFSIVLARQKGDFQAYVKGTPYISELKDGDRVLLLESCTHHVSCDDIGRVKIPRWISDFTGKKLTFDTVAGLGKLPVELHEYALVIQCGGCMITHRQLINRLKDAKKADIPVTNYGMAIAWCHGIFRRAIEPFTGKLEDYTDIL